MKVEGVGMDQYLQTVVVLRDVEAPKWLPIWIGPAEAHAIAMQMEDKLPPRPLAHDLLKNILNQLEARVVRITIHDLQENVFYATLTLETTGSQYNIDCRPSDAIALAVRTEAPIFVTGPVEEAMREDSQQSSDEEMERFRKLLDDSCEEESTS